MKIHIRPSFVIVAALAIALGYKEQFFILFLSVAAHELAHVLAARAFGLGIASWDIAPLGQAAVIDRLESVSMARRLAVLAAGPLVNLVFFVFGGGFFASANLALCVFNLVPAYPLDGGRMCHTVLGYFNGSLRANKTTVLLSKILSLLLMAVGLLQTVLYPYNVSLLCVGLYLRKITFKEQIFLHYSFYRHFTSREERGARCQGLLPVRKYALSTETPINKMLDRMGYDFLSIFYVLRNGVVESELTEMQIFDYVMNNGAGGNAGEISEINAVIDKTSFFG